MFRMKPHPSSGAQVNCNYIWHCSNRIWYRLLTWRSPNLVADVVTTVWVCSWWWMRVSSETCRAVCRKYNETECSRILLDNYWSCSKYFWISMFVFVFLCSGEPLENGTPVPKHVGLIHIMRIVCCGLYFVAFTEYICWLTYWISSEVYKYFCCKNLQI